MHAGRDASNRIGGGELDVIEGDQKGAGGALLAEGRLTAHVDQDGSAGAYGVKGGLNLDAWGFSAGGRARGLAHADTATGQRRNGDEECDPAPSHRRLG